MQVEMSEREAAAVATALKESRYIFTNKAWVMAMIERLREAAKTIACCAIVLATANAGAVTVQEVIARATSNITARLVARMSRTNAVDALASPENYALLKSTKLKDATKKLALQKQLAEAALADADATEASRIKWHGAYARQSVDWENLTATFYHADGHAVTVNFEVPNLEERTRTANRKLVRLMETNGVPVRLAEARARRNAEKLNPVTVVTVSEDANGRGK